MAVTGHFVSLVCVCVRALGVDVKGDAHFKCHGDTRPTSGHVTDPSPFDFGSGVDVQPVDFLTRSAGSKNEIFLSFKSNILITEWRSSKTSQPDGHLMSIISNQCAHSRSPAGESYEPLISGRFVQVSRPLIHLFISCLQHTCLVLTVRPFLCRSYYD